MLKREKYLSRIRPYYESDLIKSIAGIRRCGKSTILKQIIEELGGLPAVKVHCSVLADHAIKSAIYDYAQKNGKTYKGLEGFDPDADEDDHDHVVEE